MNSKIADLNVKLKVASQNAADIEMQLQAAWDEAFQDSQTIKEFIAQLKRSNEYALDAYGEIESFVRVDLSDYQNCSDQLINYLSDYHGIRADFDNSVLTSSQGESITIQDDSRWKNDNGVWLGSDQIIAETEYCEDNEVIEEKRNELIEAYMERTGYFPGVFRVTQNGDVFLVNTNKKSEK